MNIYKAVFLFLWSSKATSSVGAFNIRGGAAVDEHELAARVLGPSCTKSKSSQCGASGGGVKDLPCCDGFVCGSDGSCIEQATGPTPTTPSPSPTPPAPGPSASCGRCVVGDQPCSAPTDCPTISTEGTCSAKSTNSGNSCTNDSQCLPNSGKPANRGMCDGGGTTNTQCDTSLPCPVTSSPSEAPSSEPSESPTAALTGPQTCPEQYCPATSARKLVNAEKLLLPSNGLRKDVVDCSTDPNYELVTLDTYTAPGRSDVLIELKGPADPAYALNLVIAAPHGGSLKPEYIDTRSGSGIVTSKDSYTLEMSELTANSLIRDCAGTPYVIINHLHRSKLDANRDLAEATAGIVSGIEEAADAWKHFHTFITAAQEKVKMKYGTSEGSTGLIGVNGLFFDMHGYRGNNGSSNTAATTGWVDDANIGGAPFTQWGYRLSDEPSLTTCPLDDLSDKGSFSQARTLPNQSYECLVRGATSLGSRVDALLPNVAGISDLCGMGTPSSTYPSPYALATDPIHCHDAPGSACHYYSGGFDVEIHERMGVDLATDPPTLSGLYFNAVQAELPRCIRFGGDQIRSDSADVLAQALKEFLLDLYGPPP